MVVEREDGACGMELGPGRAREHTSSGVRGTLMDECCA